MRIFLVPLLGGWWLAAGLPGALAQQPDLSPAPATAPTPPPPATNEPPPYSLDLPDLPPSNGAGLFPNGPRQNPPPVPAASPGRNKRNKLTTGAKTKGRSLDRTLQRADSDSLDVRVSYRRAKTQALARDPGLVQLVRRADTADSDREKHAYLREYYTRLFAEVRRIDSSPAMKAHLDLLSQVAAQRYAPNRRVVAGEEDLLNGRDVGRGWLGR